MSDKKIFTNLDFRQASALVQAFFERLAADPAAPVEAQEWYDSVNKVRKVNDGTVNQTYAFQSWVLEQINALGRSQGTFDANPGALPVASDKVNGDLTALQSGDFWVISNGGTFAGILGDDVLEIGDKVQYITGDPTVAANWVGIQTNIEQVGDALAKDRLVRTLAANTPLTVSTTAIADIHSVQIYDNTGAEITVCVLKTANPNERVIESNQALSDIVVEYIGTAV